MTKSRLDTEREIYGLLGRFPQKSQLLLAWNTLLSEQGSMVHYPAKVELLPERLSEMFHFDRRLYLVSEELQAAVPALLDSLAPGVQGNVNIIVNKAGVLQGHFIDGALMPENAARVADFHLTMVAPYS